MAHNWKRWRKKMTRKTIFIIYLLFALIEIGEALLALYNNDPNSTIAMYFVKVAVCFCVSGLAYPSNN